MACLLDVKNVCVCVCWCERVGEREREREEYVGVILNEKVDVNQGQIV
jgi:hypothetical protein